MDIEPYIKEGKRCHMVGIGGVSMSPLAILLHGMGIPITGSDMNDCEAIGTLQEAGINAMVGHSTQYLNGVDYVIRTAAAREENIEIKAAREMGIPVFERAEAWGYIMRSYKNAICIAGTHGKTTTTSMVTHILLAASADPTVMIGGNLPILGSGYRFGKGDSIVLESCEYYNSFHSFFPTIAVILNIDNDHLDFFTNMENLKESFRQFASLVPPDGSIICNLDDENTMNALGLFDKELITFGMGENATVRGVNIRIGGRNPSMDVLYKGKPFCSVVLGIPGIHNLKNALAAIAVSIQMGLSIESIIEGLYSFQGVDRRFQYKGSINGADVYDDYAHHPSELCALLDAAQSLEYKRIVLAFQPHTYTRTHNLFDDFATQLSRADITLLAEIYAAREKNEIGISSQMLAKSVPGARSYPSLDDITKEIATIAKDGDLILTVGAGDVYQVGEALVNWKKYFKDGT
ncbi:MAG: UDP-N-acetylmuramate--L-alanine ligase [Oscillospiraceae bacterium]|nr:UDP-N-acetylmuramate--L-alanine ligase [Oscillospiraceae bacterium]